jgi:hypothetical protein
METPHPTFEPTVIGIDVLDVVDACDDANACGQVDRAVGEVEVLRHRAVDTGAIAAEDRIGGQNGAQRRLDGRRWRGRNCKIFRQSGFAAAQEAKTN